MKQTDLREGCQYVAKVNGKLTVVRLDRISQHYSRFADRVKTTYEVTNTRTNRQTIFRSATKFRRPA